MTETLKYYKTYNNLVLTYLILVIILCFVGPLTFGNGLGDILILVPATVLTLIHGLLTRLFVNKKNSKMICLVTGTIFLLLAVYLTWQFTIGRGIEHKWDEHVFTGRWYS